MVNAYLGLGSNMANPLRQVCLAIDEIAHIQHSSLLACSNIYKSSPMETIDNIQQDDYINAVILIKTQLDPNTLLNELNNIEKKHNRVRSEQHWGPRTLDLDILLFGDQVIESEELTIPHPGISERDFVLIPLADIDPALSIPNLGKLSNLVKKCKSHQLEKIKHLH
ncbi:MAG: 2-amino-4-hydroxy-6-hydroxymethyldihydropteridine diphosphokinase [Gammaproteobacteria bacterium]|nr:2-amino-4-hydroxy-6-hydroxymethyldihydropteridine diphosphokinase [Gammaproteobacteria bacterium]